MRVTIGLSFHRPEMVPWTAAAIAGHEAVFLEEPPDPGFHGMLQGEVPVDDYLLTIDSEYPVFSRDMCLLLQKLHAEGTAIYQVEPFLEVLLAIHEFFAAGHRPADIAPDSIEHLVYRAERAATAALLAYYHAAAAETFEEAVHAALRFARADAARFRLRDTLRAQALAPLLVRHPCAYVEAGWIHARLPGAVRRHLPAGCEVRTVRLPLRALSAAGEHGFSYSPGDRLTLRYLFRSESRHSGLEPLLAARAMIHAKILLKEESPADPEGLPHLRDETFCTRLVERLSLEDCRRLFPRLRRLSSPEARLLVEKAGKSRTSGSSRGGSAGGSAFAP